jgi:hypothetical protein
MLMSEIRAIETNYKGYAFRSRLEARWAVFFDTLGIEWKYEYQGFEREIVDEWDDTGTIIKSHKERYLPDFYLPNYGGHGSHLYVEVKGDPKAFKRDFDKLVQLHDWGGVLPDFEDSFSKQYGTSGLILLGDIPLASSEKAIFHPIVQHHKGLVKCYGLFTPNRFSVVKNEGILAELNGLNPVWGLDNDVEGWTTDIITIPTPRYFPKTLEAYQAARSARFEHGQSGGVTFGSERKLSGRIR